MCYVEYCGGTCRSNMNTWMHIVSGYWTPIAFAVYALIRSKTSRTSTCCKLHQCIRIKKSSLKLHVHVLSIFSYVPVIWRHCLEREWFTCIYIYVYHLLAYRSLFDNRIQSLGNETFAPLRSIQTLWVIVILPLCIYVSVYLYSFVASTCQYLSVLLS